MTSRHPSSRKAPALLAAATLLLAGSAFAGAEYASGVHVNVQERWALGDLGSTHNATWDKKSDLRCNLGSNNGIFCVAIDSNGVQGMCAKSNAPQSMINSLLNLTGDGYIEFRWDARNICTSIITTKGSGYQPKK